MKMYSGILTRRSGNYLQMLACIIAACICLTNCSTSGKQERPNVLLICVDDLRPELGCYGVEHIQTPNIDGLAKEGRVFTNHYVYYASCHPSRVTLLAGKYASETINFTAVRNELKNNPQMPEPEVPVSLPHLFRKNGYRTICIGKVSHRPGGVMDEAQTKHEVPFSWDLAYCPTGKWDIPWGAFFSYSDGYFNSALFKNRLEDLAPRLPYERADVPDEGYADGLNAAEAIRQLRDLKGRGDNFFLAVGFYKPHLPFNAPDKYWRLYEENRLGMSPIPNPPTGTRPEITLHNSYEPTSHYYWPWGKGNVNEEQARILRHGYFAAVSYVDAQIGKVLDELRRLEMDKNTIVVLWSDHGWHLGDHGIWGKNTVHNISLNSPLIITTPDMLQRGTPSPGIVESVDIYPTLADLCRLEAPGDLQGHSFKSQVMDPSKEGRPDAIGIRNRGGYVAHSLKTKQYRLTEWKSNDTRETVLIELYDHKNDPLETRNVAGNNPEATEQLLSRLHMRMENTKIIAE